jgi:PAS domain-containing protein
MSSGSSAEVALQNEIERIRARIAELERERQIPLAHDTTGVFRQRQQLTETNEALRESEALLRSFFDSAGVMRGIVEIADGVIVHVSCNQAAAKMYGVDRASVEGKPATELGASEEVAQRWVGLYEESRRAGKPVPARWKSGCAHNPFGPARRRAGAVAAEEALRCACTSPEY